MSTHTSPIALASSLDDYFSEPVREALRAHELAPSAATERYLVQLLSDFAKPDHESRAPLSEPVAFLLRDALEASGPERFRRLQRLGDGVLYGVGFFHREAASADRSYIVEVGRGAYGRAAGMIVGADDPRSGLDVLGELARGFDRFVEVLAWVGDWALAQSARGQAGVLALYERWQKTRSSVLHTELGQLGLVPAKNPGGLH